MHRSSKFGGGGGGGGGRGEGGGETTATEVLCSCKSYHDGRSVELYAHRHQVKMQRHL